MEVAEDLRRKKEVVDSVSEGGDVPVPGIEAERRRMKDDMVVFGWSVEESTETIWPIRVLDICDDLILRTIRSTCSSKCNDDKIQKCVCAKSVVPFSDRYTEIQLLREMLIETML